MLNLPQIKIHFYVLYKNAIYVAKARHFCFSFHQFFFCLIRFLTCFIITYLCTFWLKLCGSLWKFKLQLCFIYLQQLSCEFIFLEAFLHSTDWYECRYLMVLSSFDVKKRKKENLIAGPTVKAVYYQTHFLTKFYV